MEHDRLLYRRRNEVERLFRRLKAFRRVFTRFDKLDALFLGGVVNLRISVSKRLFPSFPRKRESRIR